MTGAPRDLRLLAGAVCLSALGDLLAMVTLAARVHDLTGSGVAVAGYFAATLVPVVVLAPLAGLLADRFESVRVLVCASLVQAAVAGALAFTGDVAGILALSALLAAGAAVSQPAEFALVPVVARAGELTRANGLVESARYVGFTLGPLVGATAAATGGFTVALLVNAASFVAIAVAAGALHARRPPVAVAVASVQVSRHGRARRTEGDRARDGFAALAGDDVLRVVVAATTGALLFISASLTVEVFYVKDVLGAGNAGYAVVTAAWTVGMVAGATGLAHRIPAHAIAVAALVALGVQGAGMAAQTAWAVLPCALAGYLVGGVGHGVKNALVRTVIQERVPARLHGRAFAAYGAARNTAELGAVGAGGLLVAVIGAREALLLAGLGPVVAALLGLLVLRRARERRRLELAPAT